MLSCKEVSKLVSDSLEEQLPFRKRIGVRMHLMMCTMCRAYRKQLLLLRQILSGYNRWLEERGSEQDRLPSEAAHRIKNTLEEHAKKSSGKNSGNDV